MGRIELVLDHLPGGESATGLVPAIGVVRRYTQSPLPYVRFGGMAAGSLGSPDAVFAHPFERTFADLLTFYGVRWTYEPTSFALTWAEDGAPREMFTPDFYLPDHRVYIELTAMRQRLVTRKHRKLRRIRELYPLVDVKLLYRRDYERIARSYARRVVPLATGRVTYRSEAEIQTRLTDLATVIADDLGADRSALCLAVGAGGKQLLSAIAHVAPASFRTIATSGVGLQVAKFRVGVGGRRVRITRCPTCDLAGRRILLFVDIVSTGLTLSYLVRWLRRRGASSVEVCALLDREAARVVEVPITYVGFPAPGDIVVGFGLSLYREFQGLDHLATLVPALPAGAARAPAEPSGRP